MTPAQIAEAGPAALALQVWVALQHQARVVAGRGQQFPVQRQAGEAEGGQARLAGAQHLACAAPANFAISAEEIRR